MRKRKIGCYVLAFFMAVTFSVPMTVSAASKFSDTRGHWAETYINQAVTKGIIKGYDNGTFRPDTPVSRAEFTSMANRALGCSGTTTTTFKDVPSGEWYYADVTKAVAAGYVAGYDENTFRPNSPISRQEAAIMISKFVPTYGSDGDLKKYPDYTSIDDWATSAMSKVNAKGYLGAYADGRIHPKDQLTRAQTAKILCDILAHETIVSSDPQIKSNGTKLSDKIYTGNVTVSKDLGNNEATIDNCVILGTLNVQGGGQNSVTLKNSRVAKSNVSKSSGTVRVLASGETTVLNTSTSNDSILQTSSLSGGTYGVGFSEVDVAGSADTTLKGSFPRVVVNGSSADITLSSGDINNLTVNTTGKNSTITVESGATISNAYANAKSSFKGNGTITTMYVNADDVSYDKKPGKVITGSKYSDSDNENFDITVKPSHKATNVSLKSNITLTFKTAMKKYNGNDITNSDIKSFVRLREDSSTGRTVPFTATINSAKKIITLDPDDELDDDTRYYVVIDANALKDTNGKGNSSQTTYFSTGDDDDDDDLEIEVVPGHKKSNVKLSTDITITFKTAMKKYNGNAIKDSDIEDFVTIRRGSSSGRSISFDAEISSNKKEITIEPDDNLDDDTRYYIIIDKNALKDTSGKGNPAQTTYFSTGDDDDDDDMITFRPKNGASDVGRDPTITITFDEKIETYSGSTIRDSYLDDDVINFRQSSNSGTRVDFEAEIDSAKKKITITPDSKLKSDQKYYLGIYSKKLRTQSKHENIGSHSVTWYTGSKNGDTSTSTYLSGLSATNTNNSITVTFTPSQTGTIYGVLYPKGSSAPATATIQQSKYNTYVSAGQKGSLTFTGLNNSTDYVFYGVLKSGSNTSSIATLNASTAKVTDIKLESLTVTGGDLSPGFSANTTSYDLTIPFNKKSFSIKAKAAGSGLVFIKADGKSTPLDLEATKTFNLSDSDTSKSITVQTKGSDGTQGTTYTINAVMEGNTDSRISIDGYSGHGSIYNIPNTEKSISITITADDSSATIKATGLNPAQATGTLKATYAIPAGKDEANITYYVTSKGQTGSTKTITLHFYTP